MKKFFAVIKREYLQRVRTRFFVVTTLVGPLMLALFGIVPGVAGGYAAARGMSALLFGIAPGDPATFGTAVAVTLATVLAGTVVPAWRAMRLSPMSVLRAE